MDGLTIWTVGGFQAERAARTKTLNGTQYTESHCLSFGAAGKENYGKDILAS